MPEVLGTGTELPEHEASSMIGTTIAQVIGFIRMIAHEVISWVTRLVHWSGENPLAASMLFMNLLIWFS